jgi:uncharacterized protein YjbI with pentapeptide repeats
VTITSQDLPRILVDHLKWLRSEPGGSRANLYGANLSGANLSGANLSRANLYGADLYGANLSGANLSGANLYGANLYGANLYGANLSGANLSRANLYGADLYGANLYGANLSGAKVAKGSKVAAIYPIGDSDRACIGVIAQSDDTHKKPFLWLVCGCFSGDEKAYRAKIAERYAKKSAHYKQCLAALVAIKALASTWEITE